MYLINTFILWIWVLSISLLIPVSLPVGGIQKSKIQQRENSINSPLISIKNFNLLSDVNNNESIMGFVKSGTPFQLLKVWKNNENGTWLLVNVLTKSSHNLSYRRGWVEIGIIG